MSRQVMLALGLFLIDAQGAAAQLAVFDAANTARNSVTAAVKEYLVNTQTEQRLRLERMLERLSVRVDLRKYRLPDPPAWRIHNFFDEAISPLARDYHAALNYGDKQGRAILAVSHPVVTADGLLNRLQSGARRTIVARLATVDAADASAIAATHDAGLTRFNGRSELAAIEALEAQVIDPSDQQSATAVLEKINGAGLVGVRQRQARVQLLGDIVEQLVIDSKRTRDADVGAMNMQLVTWRDGRVANEAFVAGTGDALRTWRQP